MLEFVETILAYISETHFFVRSFDFFQQLIHFIFKDTIIKLCFFITFFLSVAIQIFHQFLNQHFLITQV